MLDGYDPCVASDGLSRGKNLSAARAMSILQRAGVNAVFMLLVFFTGAGGTAWAAGDDQPPAGEFSNGDCIRCHRKTSPDLIDAWQQSAHGKSKPAVANCVTCHGNTHQGATKKARRNSVCIDCHGGEKDPVVHSYATSKHGIILRLEQKEWDWSQPLEQANYRAPGCAYCHLHQGNHNVSAGVRQDIMHTTKQEDVAEVMRAVCQDCHAPRYVTRLFENGEAMLNIGRMKVREAAGLLQQARTEFSPEELTATEQRFNKMRSHHLKNVLLGVGHQSPDYQWWHGHPALDGDLLRIKGGIGELKRLRVITDKTADEVVRQTGR